MAVTRISWPTVATAGSTVVYGVLIVGLPYLIVPDGVTVSSVSWTGDADTAWHVGASPTTKGWLLRKHARSDTPTLAWEETAQPVTGALDIGSLRIHLADPTVGLTAVTSSLASRDAMSFTRLTADLTAAGTTVTVESTAAFDSSGTLHLGRERITYS
ncbi:MAG TPA: hypothetical protein VFV33_20420, partial [Gemmatimonadaceae bacterium]|nr:hypothetical protein [Gemmatimonadaceae bacterium]